MNSKKIHIFTDCDGVWLGRTRERDGETNNLKDYIALMQALEALDPYNLIALTDRGGAQLPPLSYIFKASRFQGGESGAVAYDNYRHHVVTNPAFMEIIYSIKEIEQDFRKEFKCFYPLEPGVYSGIRVERVDNQNMKPVMDWLKEISKSSGGQLTCADHGDCICLKPKSINKGSGIKWLMSLYGNAGLRINFERSLWIGDGKSDIPAAQYIHKKGGKVAAVANSHPEYLKLIEKLNGYVSKNQQTAGMVEILKNVRV